MQGSVCEPVDTAGDTIILGTWCCSRGSLSDGLFNGLSSISLHTDFLHLFCLQMQDCVSKAVKAAGDKTIIGASCRDDAELAVAGTVCAVRAGAQLVQGTINGFDRMANLATIIPVLQLKMKLTAVPKESLVELTSLSRFLDEQTNQPHKASLPFVGNSGQSFMKYTF